MNIVDQQTFRDAMSYMGVTVSIITTNGPTGHAGFTASVVCSVADTPPTLLMRLNRGAFVWPVFNKSRTLCVNILSAGQESLPNLLGGKTPMGHCFVAARRQMGVTGYPRLEEALVLSDYRTNQVASVGTHDILSCAIEATHRHATPYGLVWSDRSYHTLTRPAY